MTEAEAKTKWCPMVNSGNTSQEWHDQTATHHKVNCIGSACMMWRFSPYDLLATEAEILIKEGRMDGGCGLAGKP